MRCFNCEYSDFLDNVFVCTAFKIGPVKILGKAPCNGFLFRNVWKLYGDRLIGFPISAGYPDHPDRVMIRKKEFLKKNLTEADIWEYYDRVKRHMIPFLRNKDLAVQVVVDNKTILKRHKSPKEKQYLSVNNISEFDEINNGRNVSWYIGERRETDIAIIDTDPGADVNFDMIKKYTLLSIELLRDINFVREIDCLYTGKRGFHVWGWLKRKRNINDVRETLERMLIARFGIDKNVTITKKPKPSQIRLDISINKEAGLHICPLSIRFETGLVAWWVPLNRIQIFEKKNNTIENIIKKLKAL